MGINTHHQDPHQRGWAPPLATSGGASTAQGEGGRAEAGEPSQPLPGAGGRAVPPTTAALVGAAAVPTIAPGPVQHYSTTTGTPSPPLCHGVAGSIAQANNEAEDSGSAAAQIYNFFPRRGVLWCSVGARSATTHVKSGHDGCDNYR